MSTPGLHLRAGLFGVFAPAMALMGLWLLLGRSSLPIQTDLLAMLPATERHPLAEAAVDRLAHANGDRMVLVVANANADVARESARALGQALSRERAFVSVIAELPSLDLDQYVAPYLPYRFSLLSNADRATLPQPTYDPAQTLARRLNEPFLAGIGTRLQDDPFGWLQRWLDQQPWSRSPLVPEDDLLTAHQGGLTYVMVLASLRGSSYDDGVQRDALVALDRAWQGVSSDHPGTQLLRTGAVFYAAAARAGAERDMHVVGLTSALGIALLLLWSFRSPRPLLLTFLSTAVGVTSALVATLLLFGQIHLLTLVFGAALLGEAVDYSVQYLCVRANAGMAWQPQRGVRQVRPALLLALGTSLLGYALLGVAPFPALRQMACFAMVGMTVSCLSVFWLLPVLSATPARRSLSPMLVTLACCWQQKVIRLAHGRRGLAVLALFVAIVVPGWRRVGHDDDIHLLIAQPAALAQQEARIRDITGMGNGSQFYLVTGSTPEQTLQREEALEERLDALMAQGQLDGWTGVAGMVPSAQRQRDNRSVLAPLFAPGAPLQATLVRAGIKVAVADAYRAAWPGEGLTIETWLSMPSSVPFRYLWMHQGNHSYASIVLPQGQDDVAVLRAAADGLQDVTLVDKPASVSALFGRYRQYASLWLMAALVLIGAVFAWRYGRAAARVLAPPLLGIGLTIATFGYVGQPLTLFHWMALMLVLGVGANYAVFLREGEPHTLHLPGASYASVLLSAVTALLSFGLLGLSTMPALQHFGITLLLGIGITALSAPASLPASETYP